MLRALILAVLTLFGWLLYLPVLILAYLVVEVLARMVLDGGWDERLVIAGVILAFSSGKHIFLLSWSSLLYRKRRLSHVTLLYPAKLDRTLDIEKIQHTMNESAKELQQAFEKPFLRPVVVVASPILLMHLRCRAAGFALPYTVIINPIYAGVFHQWQELARHELAHVATYRISPFKRVPALLSEGLACYFMQTENGFSLDAHALAILSEELCEPLFTMDDKTFYRRADAIRNYILAGSFASYLVHRVGWERYYRFYVSTSARKWVQDIEKILGKNIAELEQEWRHSLILRDDLSPVLPQLRLYWRVLRLIHHWQWQQAAEAAEQYLSVYGYDRLIASVAITSYFLLRQWEHCERWCKMLMDDDSPTARLERGMSLLYIGCCYDLQGRREDALGAYKAVLQELPVPAWNYESTHTIAKRHLRRAFTIAHFDRYVRYKVRELLTEIGA